MSSWVNFPVRKSWWLTVIPAVPPPTTTTLWLRDVDATGATEAKVLVVACRFDAERPAADTTLVHVVGLRMRVAMMLEVETWGE